MTATGSQTDDGDDSTPTTGAEDGNVALRAYTCTPGDDAELRARIDYQAENWITEDSAEGITIDELREVCEPADGSIPFSVTDDETGDTDELVVGGEDSVPVRLTPLASYTIAADEPDGYGEPLLFCALDGGDPSQSPIIDGNLYLVLGEGVTSSCEWFHVVIAEGDVVSADSVAIAIRSYTCTVDDSDVPDLLDRITYQIEHWTTVDPEEGITLDELHDTCEPSAEEIAFTVTDQDTTEPRKKVSGWAENDGYVTWEIAANAGYAVDADEPEGYGEPIVFCAFHDSGEPAEDLTPPPMTDGVLYVGMGVGTTYTCDWFHVDLGDPAARGGESASAVLDRGGEMDVAHHA